MTAVFVTTFAMLCVAGILTVVRLLRGRSTLDRIVALDVFVTLIVAATSVGMGWYSDGSNIALAAAFALLAFTGSVSAARLVGRRERYR